MSSAPTPYTDHIYRTKQSVPLPLRIWPCPTSSTPSKPHPWLLWTHGGAYISGNPYTPRSWVIPSFHLKNFHIVSVGYRLAPHASLEEQAQDCIDAFQWCLDNLPSLLGHDQIDVNAFAVGGESAGGTLSTILGCRLGVKPKAVINVFGIVDLVSWEKWDIAKRPEALPWKGEFTEGEIKDLIQERDESKAMTAAVYTWEKDHLTAEEISQKWGVEVKYDKEMRLHIEMKNYTDRHHGMTTIPMIMRFTSSTTTAEKEEKLKALSSIFHLTKDYPPTALLHGTGDATVPVEQSYEMASKLKELGVDYVERYCPGERHGWEEVYKPGTEGWDEYIQPIVDFVDYHVKKE